MPLFSRFDSFRRELRRRRNIGNVRADWILRRSIEYYASLGAEPEFPVTFSGRNTYMYTSLRSTIE